MVRVVGKNPVAGEMWSTSTHYLTEDQAIAMENGGWIERKEGEFVLREGVHPALLSELVRELTKISWTKYYNELYGMVAPQ